MRVTFIFGNGFDLNLGMKSSYSQFYEWYCEKYGDEFFAKKIKEDRNAQKENWADLELSLGGYTKEISKDEIELFLDEKQNLEGRLKEYLIQESNELKLDYTIAGPKFKNALVNFYNAFNENDRPEYKKFISGTGACIEYSIITLNYTDAIKNLYDGAIKQLKPEITHRANNGSTYTDKISKPLYVHGNIESEAVTNGMILGVADDSQIANSEFRDRRDCSDYLIKESVNRKMGARNIEKAKQIINESVYVCVFGTSFGVTDKLLWQYLVVWLKQGASKRLCIFARDSKLIEGSAQALVRRQDYHRRLFLERAGVDEHEQEELMNKIIVCLNSDVFDLM